MCLQVGLFSRWRVPLSFCVHFCVSHVYVMHLCVHRVKLYRPSGAWVFVGCFPAWRASAVTVKLVVLHLRYLQCLSVYRITLSRIISPVARTPQHWPPVCVVLRLVARMLVEMLLDLGYLQNGVSLVWTVQCVNALVVLFRRLHRHENSRIFPFIIRKFENDVFIFIISPQV